MTCVCLAVFALRVEHCCAALRLNQQSATVINHQVLPTRWRRLKAIHTVCLTDVVLPVLNLLTARKSAFSPRRADSLHRFMWNLAQARDTWVCLVVRNFTPIGERGWERGPKFENFHFLVKSRPVGAKPFDRFLQLLGTFYAKLSYTSV